MHIGSKTREKLANRMSGHCCWCGQKTRKQIGWQNSATIEHVVPISEGGSNNVNNLTSACWRCNNKRGNTPADQFAITAQTFPADCRTVEEANNAERRNIRKARLNGVLPLAPIQPSKLREREDKTAARCAYVADSASNPFEHSSRPWRMFEKLRSVGGDWWTQKHSSECQIYA
jgi:hypothetical protein